MSVEPTAAISQAPSRAILNVLSEGLVAGLLGLALTYLVWPELFWGWGLVGGDTYNYFMPLKTWYADGLKQNRFHFWHPFIGNGVPVLGESQTGALYPLNLLLYRFLSVPTAFNYSIIIHYCFAFLGGYALARYLAISPLPALLAATVFVFGWFPPRLCLEWALVTGAWLPWLLLWQQQWLRSRQPVWGRLLAVGVALQLLAGHFQLAWVSWCGLFLVYGCHLLRCWWYGSSDWRSWPFLGYWFGGIGLSAMQLLPTWILKTQSQRQELAFADSIVYGRIPVGYWWQWLAPWQVYPQAAEFLDWAGNNSNIIEAHLYFGLLPLLIVCGHGLHQLYRWILPTRNHSQCNAPFPVPAEPAKAVIWPWWCLGFVALLASEGTLVGLLRHVPGFGFFRYPGRYSILAALAFAIILGHLLSRWYRNQSSKRWQGVLLVLLWMLTIADLRWVGRQVQYITLVPQPLLERLPMSPVVAQLEPTDRIFAPNGNILALANVACVPPYLGLGPRQYYTIWNAAPGIFQGSPQPTADRLKQVRLIFQETGVTHLLCEAPLPDGWPVTLLWQGYDPFLHPVMNRATDRPYYLYRWLEVSSRVTLQSESVLSAASSSHIQEYESERVIIRLNLAEPAVVRLTDLPYPGWQAFLDDRPVASEATPTARLVRVPAGRHELSWRYFDLGFRFGLGVALLALIWCWGLPSLVIILEAQFVRLGTVLHRWRSK